MLEIVNPTDGDLQKVNIIGSGVLMFHRDYLLSLRKPWFFDRADIETMHRIADQDSMFVWRLQTEVGATVWVDTTIKVKHAHVFLVDDTFSDRFSDWTDPDKASLDICRFKETEEKKE